MAACAFFTPIPPKPWNWGGLVAKRMAFEFQSEGTGFVTWTAPWPCVRRLLGAPLVRFAGICSVPATGRPKPDHVGLTMPDPKRGTDSEVALNQEDGMKGPCAGELHNAVTISRDRLGRRVAT